MTTTSGRRVCCALFACIVLLIAAAGCNNSTDRVADQSPLSPKAGGPQPIPPGGGYNCNKVDLTESSFDQVLLLAGTETVGGDVDPAYEFHVTIRDSQHRPLLGIPVTISWCGYDYDICEPQSQDLDHTVVSCGGGALLHSFTAATDLDGVARFRIEGENAGGPGCLTTPFGYKRAQITVCDILTFPDDGAFTVATPNLDGLCNEEGPNCLGQGDVDVWGVDFFCGVYNARSDFDGNGAIETADLVILSSLINGTTTNFNYLCGQD